MINPTTKDIGRSVVYHYYEWIDKDGRSHLKLEDGIITSFNDFCVFVRYKGDNHSKGTRREDLEWTNDGIGRLDEAIQ